MAVDDASLRQFNTLSAYLNAIGLGELFSVDSQGNPQGWLWNQLQAGIDTDEEFRLALEQTDTFRDRFAVIVEQQRRRANGEPVYVMSPAEVIAYEKDVRQYMVSAGLPSQFYDQPEDFHALILQDFSPDEVRDRIDQAFDYVTSAPVEVRQAFDDFFGVGQGDAALAAWALDPSRTLSDIRKATRTAYSAGMAERFDIEMDRAAAARIAELPITDAGITEGLRQVASLGSIFDEGLGESATDLTDRTGLDSVFEGDAGAQRAINRRIGQRRAVNTASTGGALTTQQGVIGAGTS